MSSERHLNRVKEKHRVLHVGYLPSHRQSRWLHTLVVAVILGLARCGDDTECSVPGWFGPDCKYKCNCAKESHCQSDGECTAGCAVFWFGPKCQYRYAELREEGLDEELTILTDKNSSTCLSTSKKDIFVDLLHPQRVHWMRFELNTGASKNDISLAFWRKEEGGNSKQVCKKTYTKWDKGRSYDGFCTKTDLVHTISISGTEKSTLCSLYVAVGRNVAIREHVSQSNTMKMWVSKNTVDGVIPHWSKDITEEDLKKTCARTRELESAEWMITLPREIQISRITIYGGIKLPATDCCQSDLVPITVSAMSMQKNLVFESFLNVSAQDMGRTILPPEMNGGLVQSVVISTTNQSLTLCEVQIFEETSCPHGHYGMDCELQCHCRREHETCHPATGVCPGGCDLGYKGTKCNTPCAKGSYGYDCSKRCSRNCKNGSKGCRSDTGLCFSGCKNDYAPPYCDYPACRRNGFFGRNCKFRCKCRARNPPILCDRVTGACIKHNDGSSNGNCGGYYFGQNCQLRIAMYRKFGPRALLDQNDNTCLTDNSQITTIILAPALRPIFIRIVAHNIKAVYSWSIVAAGSKGTMSCHTQWNAQVDKNAIDFMCPSQILMDNVTISGRSLIGLCSVFVSIGREHSLNEPSTLTSTYKDYVAKRANDGMVSTNKKHDHVTCAHSRMRRGREEVWRVTVPRLRNITRIFINNVYEEKNRERLRFFGIRLIGTQNNILVNYRDSECFKNPNWFNIVDLPYTRHVIKHVELHAPTTNQYLSFCEFYLFGGRDCPHGTYGLRCEHICNCKRAEEYCFPETGACPSGCREGYRGFDCWQICPVGTYGSGCNSTCSKHCFGGTKECNGIDGACWRGCTEGYRLPTCKEVCSVGFYGRSCTKKCSRGCGGEESLCNPFTGVCEDSQCKPGFLGPKCDEICPAPNFGLDCLQNCTSACASASCHHEDGRCDDCPRGFTGDFCEERCPSHYHGPRCRHNCSLDCFQARCDPVQGRCKSCEIGLEGPYCDQMCEPGFHGWGCKERCSPHCKGGVTTCFANNGSCWYGCENDMPPPQCKEPESIFGAAAAPISMIFFAALVSLGIFAVFSERRPSPMNRRGESGGTGSEVVAASRHSVIPAISKEQSTALSKEKISKEKSSSKSRSNIRSVSSKQERSKSKELTSGTKSISG